jgi:alginate O-acetyltransferase complex protein AlgI
MVLWGGFWVALVFGALVRNRLSTQARMGLAGGVSWLFLLAAQPLATLAVSAWAVVAWYLPGKKERVGWKRQLLRFVVVGLLVQLFVWKYVPTLTGSVAEIGGHRNPTLVLGASYVTFKLIHAAIEISRSGFKVRDPVSFFAWIFLLPTFPMGPIERYDHFRAGAAVPTTGVDIARGMLRIAAGLVKKFVLVEILLSTLLTSFAPDDFVRNVGRVRVPTAWYVLGLYFMTGYLDFSASSDIAVGASRLLGFKVMENFNWPILATNMGEFWKRWHMSLSAFCQTYIYLPTIGLTRRPTLTVYTTFAAMGLWHSVSLNWVMWGVWHATGVVSYLAFARRTRGMTVFDRWPLRLGGWALTMMWALVGVAWALPPTLSGSLKILARCIGLRPGG